MCTLCMLINIQDFLQHLVLGEHIELWCYPFACLALIHHMPLREIFRPMLLNYRSPTVANPPFIDCKINDHIPFKEVPATYPASPVISRPAGYVVNISNGQW